MTVVIFTNPASGSADSSQDLTTWFGDEQIVECNPAALDKLFDQVPGVGIEAVGVCGGDGTVASVVARLLALGAETSAPPLLVVPGGTRNHFSKDLGIESVAEARRALDAFRAGAPPSWIDVAEVNGRPFVNNVSLGAYPQLVEIRDRSFGWLSKSVATVPAAIHQLVTARPMVVGVGDHPPVAVWVLFVGNGRYGHSVVDLTTRSDLADGLLDVHLVRADRRGSRARIAAALVTGRLHRSSTLDRMNADALEITLDGRRRRSSISVALDGEVVTLETPLRFRCRPRALAVLQVPEVA